MARALEAGTVAIPYHKRLWDELLAIRWMINPDARIQMLGKDELKKMLGGSSPDFSDRLSNAFGRTREVQVGTFTPGYNGTVSFRWD